MRKPGPVAFLGDINIDAFMSIPGYPPPGGDALVYDVTLRTGGSVANTAIMLSRLGLKTELYTHTGEDDWADITLNTLRREGVGLEHVCRDPNAGTGLIFIPVTPDGERTMFSYRGANILLAPEEIRAEDITALGALHFSGYSFLKSTQREAAWKALEIAQQVGVPITLDLGVEPAVAIGADLPRLFAALDLLVLGDQEVTAITRQSDLARGIGQLLDAGVKTIGLKLGKDGCEVISAAQRARLPGMRVDVVDTTGAGDAFSAGLIYGALREMTFGARGLLANALGALATTVWGGGAALPSLNSVIAFIQDRPAPQTAWKEEVLAELTRCLDAANEDCHD